VHRLDYAATDCRAVDLAINPSGLAPKFSDLAYGNVLK
jgi:hypothetical protein